MEAFPVPILLAIFVLLAAGIRIAGTALTRAADVLADRHHLTGSIVGPVLLAAGEPAGVDARGDAPRRADRHLRDRPGAVAFGTGYVGSILLLRRCDAANDRVPVDLPDEIGSTEIDADRPGGGAGRIVAACCAAILPLGLVWTAETPPARTGLAAGLIGATLLAAATSLPELSATVAAVRMGAHTLAIGNVFGSIPIMRVLVLPADAIYRDGPIPAAAGNVSALAICAGPIVTDIYLTGLIVRRERRVGRPGIDSAMVLAVYATCLLAYRAAG
jgi:cation:H+ antiporter